MVQAGSEESPSGLRSPVEGSKFTPGPWNACKIGECRCGHLWDSSGNACVVTAYNDEKHRVQFTIAAAHTEWGDAADMVYGTVPLSQAAANARLISAAPDMYEALKRMVNHYGVWPDLEAPGCIISNARAALAKADGTLAAPNEAKSEDSA